MQNASTLSNSLRTFIGIAWINLWSCLSYSVDQHSVDETNSEHSLSSQASSREESVWINQSYERWPLEHQQAQHFENTTPLLTSQHSGSQSIPKTQFFPEKPTPMDEQQTPKRRVPTFLTENAQHLSTVKKGKKSASSEDSQAHSLSKE